MLSSSIDQATPPPGDCGAQRAPSVCGAQAQCNPASPVSGLVVAVGITALASFLHVLASRAAMPFNSLWFVLTGVGFLAVTVAAHSAVSQGGASGSESVGEVGALLISMAIRLAGTFAILGLLLTISPLQRREAVCNVLFWYITLTATDLAGLVRDRRRMHSGYSAAPAGDATRS